MKAYFSFLREVRKCPEMFVGQAPSQVDLLQRIELFLLGFEIRETYEKSFIATDWNRKFRDFVAIQEKAPRARVAGVVFALWEKHTEPQMMWDDFFRLVDEFEGQV